MTSRLALLIALCCHCAGAATVVAIHGDDFQINGKPTFAGRVWQGHRVEGLLPNSRMVQGLFDDLNPDTISKWAYPDTGRWDAGRNTREFVTAMPEWRKHGLLAITLNLQGGSPFGYSKEQPWHNSAIEADGSLRADYLARAERIITRADELGMVVILGVFYFGQDQRVRDERAVIAAVEGTARWILGKGWQHVFLEINNEANVHYDHAILQPQRVHELIDAAKSIEVNGRRLLVSTSFGGGKVPVPQVIEHADFLLVHGNGIKTPEAMRKFLAQVKAARGSRQIPIVVNEDDHFAFDQLDNNFTASVGEHVSWGFFDYRMKGEGFDEGYQSVPVNWGVSSKRKQGFFELLSQITGESLR